MRLSYLNHLNFIYDFTECNEIYYRFAEMIEKSLNIVFLCEMVGCTIIICFLEFGVLKVFPLKINGAKSNYPPILHFYKDVLRLYKIILGMGRRKDFKHGYIFYFNDINICECLYYISYRRSS